MIALGDLSLDATRHSKKIIESILNRNQKLREVYYILMAMQAPHEGQLLFVPDDKPKVLFKTMLKRPPKMLSTACWRVDNKAGKLELLWCLPLDCPVPDEFLEKDKGNDFVAKSAEGIDIDG